MKLKSIYLSDREIKKLQQEAKLLGISVSELIRRILDKELWGEKGK